MDLNKLNEFLGYYVFFSFFCSLIRNIFFRKWANWPNPQYSEITWIVPLFFYIAFLFSLFCTQTQLKWKLGIQIISFRKLLFNQPLPANIQKYVPLADINARVNLKIIFWKKYFGIGFGKLNFCTYWLFHFSNIILDAICSII